MAKCPLWFLSERKPDIFGNRQLFGGDSVDYGGRVLLVFINPKFISVSFFQWPSGQSHQQPGQYGTCTHHAPIGRNTAGVQWAYGTEVRLRMAPWGLHQSSFERDLQDKDSNMNAPFYWINRCQIPYYFCAKLLNSQKTLYFCHYKRLRYGRLQT